MACTNLNSDVVMESELGARQGCHCEQTVSDGKPSKLGCKDVMAQLAQLREPSTVDLALPAGGLTRMSVEEARAELRACIKKLGRCKVTFHVHQSSRPERATVAGLLAALALLVVLAVPKRLVRVSVDADGDTFLIRDHSLFRRANEVQHAVSDIEDVLQGHGGLVLRMRDDSQVSLVEHDTRSDWAQRDTLNELRALLAEARAARADC